MLHIYLTTNNDKITTNTLVKQVLQNLIVYGTTQHFELLYT